jgi:hypothetical protein
MKYMFAQSLGDNDSLEVGLNETAIAVGGHEPCQFIHYSSQRSLCDETDTLLTLDFVSYRMRSFLPSLPLVPPKAIC